MSALRRPVYEKLVVYPRDIADEFGVPRQRIHEMCRNGQLPPFDFEFSRSTKGWNKSTLAGLGYPAMVRLQPRRLPIEIAWDRYVSASACYETVMRGVKPGPSPGPAIYLMIYEGRVVYVGQSIDVSRRIKGHSRKYWQRLVVMRPPQWWPAEELRAWLNQMEYHACCRYRPADNYAQIHGARHSSPLATLFQALPDTWPAAPDRAWSPTVKAA